MLTETCSRCDSDQTGDDARAEAHQAELLGVDVVKKDPANTATTCRKVGVDDDVDGSQAEVGRAGAVEGEPSEPDEDSADAHEQRVVRLVVHALLGLGGLVGETGTQHEGPGEGAEATGDVDGTRACKVVEAELVQPAAGVPFPVGETVMDGQHACLMCDMDATHM